jgi:hypothetical protein
MTETWDRENQEKRIFYRGGEKGKKNRYLMYPLCAFRALVVPNS